MEDRLKFRAWHKPTKKMFKVFCFTDKEVFENTIDGVGTSPTNPANINDCVIMQCTGLKDKKGKLIYEGDIIKDLIFNEDDELAIIKFGNSDDFGGSYQCFYPEWLGEYSKRTKYSMGWRRGLVWWCESGIEVVGNIHENPELLKRG